ncbi:M13 family metallopeptidase [Velocimicrobium porci]|uniref:M13 family metallopeptidase n=1 Tax=Velocimicrobium porci TaxID=2606634 RepID=A0A6L5Y0G9_9FIRM|nr:M13 family metallopeptidase [Velocimicrobium porci]MSS63918.1 M13 family metallopeptidase [Velocimicrobium porci]
MRGEVAVICSQIIAFSLLFTSCEGIAKEKKEVYANKEGQVRLQDDYYDYINGSLIQKKQIPADETGWNYFNEVSNQAEKQLNDELKHIVTHRDEYEKNSSEYKIASIYLTAKDMERRDLVGFGDLKPYINRLLCSKNISEYLKAMAVIQKDLGKGSLFALEAQADLKNSNQYALYIGEPNLMIGKEGFTRDYFEDRREAYKNYITEILKTLGEKKENVVKISEKIYELQEQLAKEALDAEESGNPSVIYNPLTKEELKNIFTNIDILGYLTDSGLDNYQNYIAVNPAVLKTVNQYLKEGNLSLLKKYSAFILVSNYSGYLTKEIQDDNQNFVQILNGTKEKPSEEKTWSRITQELVPMEFGKIYVEKNFSAKDKKKIEKMIDKILMAYQKKIEGLDWMSADTKTEAKKKLDCMTVKVGYPDLWSEELKQVSVKAPEEEGVFINNVLNIQKTAAKRQQEKMNKPVDKSEWGMSPQTVNAYYNPSANEIVFPAAILQEPFYNRAKSEAVNLGGIGMVIAHEITHAFDNNGAKYDEKGNLHNWWTQEDYKNFEKLNEKVIEYYNQYEIIDGYKVNGKLTLGENIADLGAMSCVSDIVGNNKTKLRKLYTQYAKIWACKYNKEEQLSRMNSDPHSPGKVRVNAVLSSMDKFYRAYSIKKGDRMYVAPKDRVNVYE